MLNWLGWKLELVDVINAERQTQGKVSKKHKKVQILKSATYDTHVHENVHVWQHEKYPNMTVWRMLHHLPYCFQPHEYCARMVQYGHWTLEESLEKFGWFFQGNSADRVVAYLHKKISDTVKVMYETTVGDEIVYFEARMKGFYVKTASGQRYIIGFSGRKNPADHPIFKIMSDKDEEWQCYMKCNVIIRAQENPTNLNEYINGYIDQIVDKIRKEVLKMTTNENKNEITVKILNAEEENTMAIENKNDVIVDVDAVEIGNKEEETKMKKTIKIYLAEKGGRYPFTEEVRQNRQAMARIMLTAQDQAGYGVLMPEEEIAKEVNWIFVRGKDEEFDSIKKPVIVKMESIYRNCGFTPVDVDKVEKTEAAEETYNYSDNGNENCVITRSEVIGKFKTSKYALPENYETMSLKDLFWAYMNADQQAELQAERNMDLYGSEHAPEESAPVEERKKTTVNEIKMNRARRRNPKAAIAMQTAHDIRRALFSGVNKGDISYHAIMSICLQVAWAQVKGQDVSKEYPWIAQLIMKKVTKLDQQNKIKAAQETAKVNAEKRKAEAEAKKAEEVKTLQAEAYATGEEVKTSDPAILLQIIAFKGLKACFPEKVLKEYPEFLKLFSKIAKDMAKTGKIKTRKAATKWFKDLQTAIAKAGAIGVIVAEDDGLYHLVFENGLSAEGFILDANLNLAPVKQ